MQVEIQNTKELCPVGPATFRLVSVEAKPMPSFDGTGTVTRWIWQFVSNKKAPDGSYYEIAIFTGQKYGHAQAKLTWMLDFMVPGITAEQAARLNTNDFIGTDWEAMVKHQPTEKDPSVKVATFSYLKPLGAPAPPPDIFADDDIAVDGIVRCEVCSQELSDKETAACAAKWDNRWFCAVHGKAQIMREIEAASSLFAEA